jgi:hypothetical protein
VFSHADRMQKSRDVRQFNLAHFPELIAGVAEKEAARAHNRGFGGLGGCG